MYNTDLPTREELPSSAELIRSTLIAAVVALLLLVTTILPAEYSVDPTGIGRLLGLTQMGEIKTSLAAEAAQADKAETSANSLDKPTPIITSTEKVQTNNDSVENAIGTESFGLSHQKIFTLKPGAATEIKLAMKKGARVDFNWVASGGKVNFDTHGDSKDIDYHGYNKGRQVRGDKGEIIAAFDGSHGWFWRNRSAGDVTITLITQGNYQSIDRKI